MRVVGALLVSGVLSCTADSDEGGGGPISVERLDKPVPVVMPELSDELIRLEPSQLNVKRDLTLLFSTSNRSGGFNPFTQEVVDTQRDAIYGVDYGTGVVRELDRESNEGRFLVPLPALVDQGQVYYVRVEAGRARDQRDQGSARAAHSHRDTVFRQRDPR